MADHKVVVVTGGASGIGLAVVTMFLEHGASVAVLDSDGEGLAKLRSDSALVNRERLHTVQCDVTNVPRVRAAVEQVANEVGPPSITVANAGIEILRPFVETDEGFWRNILEVNLIGQLAVIRATLPHMLTASWGRVVTMASEAGRAGTRNGSPYSAAKGGVIGFTKAIAREVAHKGVTANSVAPGPIDTPLMRRLDSESPDDGAALLARVPMGRLGTAREVASAVMFLASEDASFITGQVLSVNGGLSMA